MQIVAQAQATLNQVTVRRVTAEEESRFSELLARHHYLGALPKIGQTLWYVACVGDAWCALASFSGASLKCASRDQLIGWRRQRAARLKLLANNSRFLILPEFRVPNLGSRVLSLCERALARDWPVVFGHPLLLLETFVDPARFAGTVYRASNWTLAGATQGFARTAQGYREHAQPKLMFVKALYPHSLPTVCAWLSAPVLAARFHPTAPLHSRSLRMTITAVQMSSLLDIVSAVPDPRRREGIRHPLRTVLALIIGATLCGAQGYKAIADWVTALSPQARERFGCRRRHGKHVVPSLSAMRNVLIGLAPEALTVACQRWNQVYAGDDTSLSLDGKTLRGALNADGEQPLVLSIVGHHSQRWYAQKKSARAQTIKATKSAPTNSAVSSHC